MIFGGPIFLKKITFILIAVTLFVALAIGSYFLFESSEVSAIQQMAEKLENGDPDDARFAAHILKIKDSIPPGFYVTIQKPFVVVGDEAPSMVRRRAQKTVGWAVKMIKQDYFEKDPENIVTVWLFKNKESYLKYNLELFDTEDPGTKYGYYSPEHDALVMNISTGGGTLVHEIVHPFMDTNFPACPAWFNEGLASLYEQSNERLGHIVGLPNWRLKGLQDEIDKKALPSFEDLCGTTTEEFYEEDRADNYAQARYLCYYLQEHDLLTTYYKEFVSNQKADPTGFQTLKSILEEADMQAFQKRWQEWVMTISY